MIRIDFLEGLHSGEQEWVDFLEGKDFDFLGLSGMYIVKDTSGRVKVVVGHRAKATPTWR